MEGTAETFSVFNATQKFVKGLRIAAAQPFDEHRRLPVGEALAWKGWIFWGIDFEGDSVEINPKALIADKNRVAFTDGFRGRRFACAFGSATTRGHNC